MQAREFGLVLFHAAVEAGFLDVEIADGFFVFEIGFDLDELRATRFGLIIVELGEFDLTFEENAGLEVLDAGDAPGGIEQGLDERLFFVGGWCEALVVEIKEVLVFGGVVCGQEDGFAGESVLEGVFAGGRFAGFGDGSGG